MDFNVTFISMLTQIIEMKFTETYFSKLMNQISYKKEKKKEESTMSDDI